MANVQSLYPDKVGCYLLWTDAKQPDFTSDHTLKTFHVCRTEADSRLDFSQQYKLFTSTEVNEPPLTNTCWRTLHAPWSQYVRDCHTLFAIKQLSFRKPLCTQGNLWSQILSYLHNPILPSTYSLVDEQQFDDRTSYFINWVNFDTVGHWTAENIIKSSAYSTIQNISGTSVISKEYLDGIVLPCQRNQ